MAAHSPAAAALVEAAALCNDASLHEKEQHWVLAGDPTEGALLTLAMKAGLSPTVVQVDRPRLDVIPFESEHRFMATLHACEAGSEVLVRARRNAFWPCALAAAGGRRRRARAG